jgi:hypothetical protein
MWLKKLEEKIVSNCDYFSARVLNDFLLNPCTYSNQIPSKWLADKVFLLIQQTLFIFPEIKLIP